MRRLIAAGLAAWLALGCVRNRGDYGYPLYARGEATAGVATIVGDVASVDGRDLSGHGHRFLVLPGCHTVTNVGTWQGTDANGAAIAHLPEVPFNADMKPGLIYVLRIGIKGPLRENWKVALTFVEQDRDGHVLRNIEPRQSC